MKIKAPYLTKSKYVKGVRCLKALYLNEYHQELGKEPKEADKFRMEQGKEVGNLAKKEFSGGVEILWSGSRNFEDELKATQDALQKNVPAIFEATFAFNNILVKVDILERTEMDPHFRGDDKRVWNLIEVKSSTKLEEEHIDDVSVQYYVLKNCGVKVNKVFLMCINTACVYPDLSNFFEKEDISEQVESRQEAVESQLKKQFQILGKSSEPNIDIGSYCDRYSGNTKDRECEFKPYCWKHIKDDSVFELYRLGKSKKFDLYYSGSVLIKDLPSDFPLSAVQEKQVDAVNSGKPFMDREGIKEFLRKIEYPVRYLDFETANPAIPLFDGIHPYEQIPFQFSCYARDADGNLEHSDFISLQKADPREEFVKALLKSVGKRGSILVYHAPFEKGRLTELAEAFPEYKFQIDDIKERILDLEDIFPEHYYHPNFHGSMSIKRVLPVLCPDVSYSGLAITGGGEASTAYLKIQKGDLSQKEVSAIQKNLREYCQMDTMAMVKIHEFLEKLE
ncbi:MAG: DUF2779 domain-containing protein [Deltaproteobacteria bacterium]